MMLLSESFDEAELGSAAAGETRECDGLLRLGMSYINRTVVAFDDSLSSSTTSTFFFYLSRAL